MRQQDLDKEFEKIYEDPKNCCNIHRIMEDLYEKVRLLNCIDEPKWVSVKDKLPPNGQYVLVAKYDGRNHVKMHFTQIAARSGEVWIDDFAGDVLDPKYGEVTHWMQIPDLPIDKKERNEQ